ncbi:MAG TPA: hypothetical protein VK968_11405, partial [Roseimicrobium sp.]|nr:hypothetical protein [Roseimicrobium sp.]
MPFQITPLELERVRVFPLEQRRSESRVDDILVAPDATMEPLSPFLEALVERCATDMVAARNRGASRQMIYGAHLIKNGAHLLVNDLVRQGWITHLATNGAGTIHDWEFSHLGRSTESVRDNVATGSFGTWEETGRCIQLALLVGALRGEGYGVSLGRFIAEDGTTLPEPSSLESLIRAEPAHPLSPARAELLMTMRKHGLHPGRITINHPWKQHGVLAQAFLNGVPVTVHPGIGYDIIANHPMFNGAAIGRAADLDFRLFGGTVEKLDGGVVLSVGSAIMGPQVFEKSISCVNNLRIQDSRPIVRDHSIYVVDIQDGGNWDWTRGEPPKDNPAY